MVEINNNFSNASHLATTQRQSSQVFSRLSSGNRINSANDDAAGLAISDRMDAQVRGLNQAARNAGDGISLTQTVEGALSETTAMLQRMRELAVQANNGIYNDSDRRSMNQEFSQLQEEIGRIAEETSFNGQNLLDGSMSEGMVFQVGANGGETIEVAISGATPSDLAIDSLSLATAEEAGQAIGRLDSALTDVSELRADMGAYQSRFDSAIENLGVSAENTTAANSSIADADFAAEVSEMVTINILKQANIAVQAQANQSAGVLYSLLK